MNPVKNATVKKSARAILTKSRTLFANDNDSVMCLFKVGKSAKGKNIWTPVWRSSTDVRKGDVLVVADQLPDDGKPYILPDGRATTNSFTRLVGCFIGDGYVRIRKAEGGQLSLCLFKDKHIQTYSKIVEEWFGRPLRQDNRGAHLYSIEAARYFEDIGLNKKSYEKVVPDWMWGLPHEQIKSMFAGLLDSDGYHNKYDAWAYEMNNEKLVRQLHALAQMVGYRTSNIATRFRKSPNKNKKGMLIEQRHRSACFQIYPNAVKRLAVDGSGYYGVRATEIPDNCGTERVTKIEEHIVGDRFGFEFCHAGQKFKDGVLVLAQ